MPSKFSGTYSCTCSRQSSLLCCCSLWPGVYVRRKEQVCRKKQVSLELRLTQKTVRNTLRTTLRASRYASNQQQVTQLCTAPERTELGLTHAAAAHLDHVVHVAHLVVHGLLVRVVLPFPVHDELVLVHARGQQAHDGEVLPAGLQPVALRPVVKGALHFHVRAAMRPAGQRRRAEGAKQSAPGAFGVCIVYGSLLFPCACSAAPFSPTPGVSQSCAHRCTSGLQRRQGVPCWLPAKQLGGLRPLQAEPRGRVSMRISGAHHTKTTGTSFGCAGQAATAA